ncbi:unnamed protein product [Angiostrongylus costaricensis]|uniref:RING-type domain-containing protein n=1 Tax=Angiostrongylus costaricensis TaxID=334426 RepID=A0A0R3PPA5_ANGCS|nr:unnamed protein product [Angiostrongylus costaricensis]
MENSIVNSSSGNVLVNDAAVSCGQKKELAFHDVITLVEGPQCIHLTFGQKRGTGIMDRSRPCLTWESKSFLCVRYLEEKKLFTIGSDRDPRSVSFCFYNEESEAVNEATSSTHQIQSTVSSSIPESSASISQSRRRSSYTPKKLQMGVTVNQQVVRQEQNETLSLNQLEANLTCCVCLNIFFKPVNIDPCNHKCCYSCVLSWLRQTGFSGKCPQCRTTILCIKLDPALNNIVETFLHLKPTSEERNINEYQHLLQYSLTADAFRSQRRAPFRQWMP